MGRGDAKYMPWMLGSGKIIMLVLAKLGCNNGCVEIAISKSLYSGQSASTRSSKEPLNPTTISLDKYLLLVNLKMG